MRIQQCRYCGSTTRSIIDLGSIPLVNYFPKSSDSSNEKRYPLRLVMCNSCGLLQLDELVPASDIFSTYHYVTGASAPLVKELSDLSNTLIKTYKLTSLHQVLDIGSNDGTLLSFFHAKGIKSIGIEPSRALATISKKRSVETICGFFSQKTANQLTKKYGQFDVITATHVLANIIDLSDFFRGVSGALAPGGVYIAEVADAEVMIKKGQFDAMYHEHYSYFTLRVLKRIAYDHGLKVIASTRSSVQGGAIRVVMSRSLVKATRLPHTVISPEKITRFRTLLEVFKTEFQALLAQYKGKTIVGFGAPAKSVTLASYLGLSVHEIAYIVDSTELKQGRLHPGTAIPIMPENYLLQNPPDVIILFSWNYSKSILEKLRKLLKKPTACIIPFPKLRVVRV